MTTVSKTAAFLLAALLSCALFVQAQETPAQQTPAPGVQQIPVVQGNNLQLTLEGKVIRVHDGDTITLQDQDNREFNIRLQGIDAPELKQAFGQDSQKSLSRMVLGKKVTIIWNKLDRYGRTVGTIMLDGKDVNIEQVKAGLAWHFKKYEEEQTPVDREVYAAAEQVARAGKLGLWSDQKSIAPGDYRLALKLDRWGPPPPEGTIIGNSNSRKYHRPDCAGYRDMAERNRVFFKTVAEAEAAGFKRAGNCPPEAAVALQKPEAIVPPTPPATVVSVPAATVPTFPATAGNWLGVVDAGGIKLRLGLKAKQQPDGKLSAKLDSLDQAAYDLPIDSITSENGLVRFKATTLGLSYEGKLTADGLEIIGELKQGPATFPVTFKRTENLPALSRPQDPQKPYPYTEEEVSYENPVDKVKLTGTLTLPPSKSPVPAVILITGSGAQDRNETIMGHRPFLVLADHLTRRGIAVLRVDDRGMGGSSLGPPTATSENYSDDVLAGIAYLKTKKEINPSQIGLIGHSEGGVIAPIAAVKSKDVSFVVMMAGIGQTGRDAVLMQNDLLTRASGMAPEATAQVRKIFERLFDILKVEKDNSIAGQKMRDVLQTEVAVMTEDQKKALAPVLRTINAQLPLYSSSWFRYFLSFDPTVFLEKVSVPVLALVGDKDLQVPPKENLALIEGALKKGGNKNYTIVLMPGLNHLFQTSKTGLPSEYGTIEETISPVALQTMSDWILKQTQNGDR